MDYLVASGRKDVAIGIYQAQLLRFHLFKAHQRQVKLLQLNYDRLAHSASASAGVYDDEFINMFDYYQKATDVKAELTTIGMVRPGNALIEPAGIEGDIQAYNYRENGQLMRQVRLDAHTNAVVYVLVPNALGQVVETDTYDVRGFKSRVSLRNAAGKPLADEYYTPAGELAMRIDFAADQAGEIEKITLKDGREFSSMQALQCDFLMQFNQGDARFFFDDAYPLEALRLPLAHKIVVLHRDHRRPQSAEAQILRAVQDSDAEVDAIMVSTPAQAQDVQTLCPEVPVVAIPAGINQEPLKPTAWATHERKTLVAVTAITPESGIDAVIDAFIELRTHFPQLKLEVYGAALRKQDQQFLHRLKMRLQEAKATSAVAFRGYREDLQAVYAHAGLLLVTTPTEGFSLPIQQAMAQGLPTVAYDVAYGAQELIVDGKNGYLVSDKHASGLVGVIWPLLNDRPRHEALSQGCHELAPRYNQDKVWQAYCELPGGEL